MVSMYLLTTALENDIDFPITEKTIVSFFKPIALNMRCIAGSKVGVDIYHLSYGALSSRLLREFVFRGNFYKDIYEYKTMPQNT